MLCWPETHQLPTDLPLTFLRVSDGQLEALLCAELLRHAQLSPLGPVPEWVRQILNDALDPLARKRLFGHSKKLSQEQFAQWLGLSRGQLAHQSRRLSPPEVVALPQPASEPAFFKEWLVEHNS